MLVPVALALTTQVAEPSTDPVTDPVLVVRGATPLALAEATVQRALEGHLADLGYAVHVDLAPGERPWPTNAVRVTLDDAPEGGLRVTMQRVIDPRPWARTLPPQTDPDLWLESLGVVVRAMLDAPAAEPEPEPTPEPPPEPEPEPPENPPEPMSIAAPSRTWAFDLGLGYRGDTLAPGHRWHSSAALDLAVRLHAGVQLGGHVAYTPPHAGADLDLRRVGGALRVGYAFRPKTRLQPSLAVVMAAEGLGWSNAPADTQAQPGWGARVGAGLSAELRGFVTRRWFVAARVGALAWARGITLQDSTGRTLVGTEPLAGQVWVGVGHRWSFAQ